MKHIFFKENHLFSNFLIVFLPIFLIFALFAYSTNQLHKSLTQKEFKARTLNYTQAQQQYLEKLFQDFQAQTRFVAHWYPFAPPIKGLEAKQHTPYKTAQAYLNSSRFLNQISLFNRQGQELAKIVRSQLEPATSFRPNLSRNDFFKQALNLKQKEVLFSSIHPKKDHGLYQLPLTPIFQAAIQLDPAKAGSGLLLLLEFSGNKLLAEIQQRAQGMDGHIMVLNQDGYFLLGMNQNDQWGHLMPARKEKNLKNSDPKAWKKISQKSFGMTTGTQGTYVFSTLNLSQTLISSTHLAQPQLKLVQHFLESNNFGSDQEFLYDSLLSFLLISLLLACGSFLYAREKTGHSQANHDLRQIQNELEQRVEKQKQALIRSEEHYKAVVESSSDGILIVAFGKVRFANRQFLTLSGYLLEEIIGLPSEQLFSQMNLTTTTHTEGLSHVQEGWLVTKRQENLPIEFYHLHFTYQSSPAQLFFIRDNRDRKQAEQEILRLHQAVVQSPVSIIITDLEGKIIYANPKCESLTGYSLEELREHTPRIFKSGHQHPSLYRDLWDKITHGKPWYGELLNKKKNGTLYWESSSISPIRDAQGNIINFLGVKEDITKAKQQAEELKKAKEAAEMNSRIKADFLATMSHEIRTPMNGLIGMSSLLEETDLSLEQAQYVETLKSSGQNLLRVINDILDFSKIEAGKLTLDPHPFRLRDCIEEVMELFAFSIAEKELELFYSLDPNLPQTLIGDEIRIKQILVNLLSNAIKFTSLGQIWLRVRQGPPGSNLELRFSIEDTGIGIDPKELKNLFKPFTQADSSTTRNFGGTGLGLAISKRLAEIMDGSMWAESTKGQGSTFYFTILLQAAQGNHRPQLMLSKPARLLCLSGNPHYAQYLQELGAGWPLDIQRVTGYKAAKAALQLPLDALLIDLAGRGFSDLGCTTQEVENLLDRAIQQGLPVVQSQFIKERSFRDDPSHQSVIPLLKPLRRTTLLNALEQALGTSPQAPETTNQLNSSLAIDLPLDILLVEDNKINQLLAIKILNKLGYTPTTANHGGEALTLVKNQNFDLIFMDIQMPVLDGVAATQAIRGLPIPQPIIIAMTANAMPGDRQKYLDAGIDDYMAKPVHPKNIEMILEKWSGKYSKNKIMPDSSPTPLLDLDLLEGRSLLGLDFMQRFVQAYYQQLDQVIPLIQEAVTAKDFLTLQTQGHILKGIAANMGTTKIAELGKKFQFKGEDTNPMGLEELLKELKAALPQTKTALEEYVQTLASSSTDHD